MSKPRSLTSEKAKKILSDGQVRDTPLTPKQRRFMGAVAGGNSPVSPGRTNVGGFAPPAKPIAKQTPKPSKNMAIGERPMLTKTASKIAKMRR